MNTAELIREREALAESQRKERPQRRGGGVASALARGVRGVIALLRSLPARTVRGVRAVGTAALDQPRRALVAMLVAVVVLGAATALFVSLARAQTATDAAAAQATETAQNSITTLLSYDYRTVGGEIAQRQDLITGHFRDEYGALVRDVVTPAANAQQTVTQTSVANAAPTDDVSTSHVSVLLFLNQTTTVAGKADPVFSGSRVRVGLDNVDGRWLVSDVTPI